MRALILMIGMCGSLCAANLTVIVGDGKDGALNLEQLSLYRLFDSIESIRALKSDVGEDRVIFRSLPEGAYSVVGWSKKSIWAASPEIDKTVLMEDADIVVDLRNVQKSDLRPTIISFSKSAFKELGKFWQTDEFVPCRIQRIEGIMAPSFGFRWVMLKKTDNNTLEGEMPMAQGDFTLTIPYPTGTEAYPPPKVPSNQLSQPLFSFPFSVEPTWKCSCGLDSISIDIVRSSNRDQGTKK